MSQTIRSYLTSNDRRQAIDVIRAIAVFLVLGRHFRGCPASESPLFHTATCLIDRGGWVAMDLLFVMSGFLVAGLLFREYERYNRISFKSFFIRRGLRIYPAYWVMLCFTMALAPQHITPLKLVGNLLFLQNYSTRLTIWGHLWSLAVEEHFYVILAVVMFFLLKKGTSKSGTHRFDFLQTLFFITAVGCLLYRCVRQFMLPNTIYPDFYSTQVRLDELFFGVLLSYWCHSRTQQFERWQQKGRYVLLVLGTLLLVPPFIFGRDSAVLYTVGHIGLYAGVGCIITSVLDWKTSNNAAIKAFAYIGARSYSIYLWHFPLWFVVSQYLDTHTYLKPNWGTELAIFAFVSVGAGCLLSSAIELPVLKIRDRYFPSRSAAIHNAEPPLPTPDPQRIKVTV